MNDCEEETDRLGGHEDSSVVTTKNRDAHTFLCSTRWRTIGYVFLSFMLLYMHRVNLSLAIVCMVNTTDRRTLPDIHTNSSDAAGDGYEVQLGRSTENPGGITHSPPGYHINETRGDLETVVKGASTSCLETVDADTSQVRLAELYWQKSEISILLSSYFYGSFFMQIPSGTMADVFGGKHIITAAMLVSVVCSLVTPVCARHSIILMYIVRIVLGLAGGAVIPAGMSIMNAWATPNERPVMIASLASGLLTGTIATFLTSGFLCVYGFDNGWPSIFYIHGIVTVLFLVLWLVEARSVPEDYPRISSQELQFIQSSRGHSKHTKRPKTPWKRLLLSRPLWATIVAHFCYNWSFFTVLINVPLFLKEVLKFDVKANGLYSSLPYVFQIISSVGCGKMSVVVIKKKCLGLLATRRTFNTCCFLGVAACLVSVGYISCEVRYLAVILLCLSCTFSGFAYGGFFANHPEYAGQFAGTAFGITNAGGVISSIGASVMAGLLTPNGQQEEWRRVFYIAAGLDLFGAVVFYALADVYLQPWASASETIAIEVEAATELVQLQYSNHDKN